MHVAGFTKDPSSGVDPAKRGTYAGLIDKIPYLQDLGVTAVELQPVFQFDEQDAPARLTIALESRSFSMWFIIIPRKAERTGQRYVSRVSPMMSITSWTEARVSTRITRELGTLLAQMNPLCGA